MQMKNKVNNRRDFLKNVGITGLALGLANVSSFAFAASEKPRKKAIRIGWITDLHHGTAKNSIQRLQAFLADASKRKLDFILQGGDFCHPIPSAEPLMKVWNGYPGDRYHVLGNHDMDKGTKDDIMKFWGMKEKNYSFDKGDFHFVVLDCNYIFKNGEYIDYANSNYFIDQQNRDLVNPEQIEWLKKDLELTNKQTIIISHQAFDEIWDGWSVPNRHLVRKVIDDANNRTGFQKVIACFCGHHHVDDHSYINKVHYFQMNSASHYYAGEGFGSDGPRSVYKDPLYAFVTIDPSGQIIIEGKQSQFESPSPTETKHPDAARISAGISNRKEKFNI